VYNRRTKGLFVISNKLERRSSSVLGYNTSTLKGAFLRWHVKNFAAIRICRRILDRRSRRCRRSIPSYIRQQHLRSFWAYLKIGVEWVRRSPYQTLALQEQVRLEGRPGPAPAIRSRKQQRQRLEQIEFGPIVERRQVA